MTTTKETENHIPITTSTREQGVCDKSDSINDGFLKNG